MKVLEKQIVLFLFLVVQLSYAPLWAIDVPSIQGKYECNFQRKAHDCQVVIQSTKELPKDSRSSYHIGNLQHIPGTDTNIDNALFAWLDLEDDKDSSASKKTAKAINYPLKKTTGIYPTNVTNHKSPLFLLDSSFLL